jgi:hypothetical protein
MHKLILVFSFVALVVMTCDGRGMASTNDIEHVITFAIQQEASASNHTHQEICVGFGHGLVLHEKIIFSALRHNGINAHGTAWCTNRGQGLSISVIAPVKESSPGTFEVTVQVGDASIKQGEHFATLLKRGTYIVHSGGSSELQLLSYKQTCCYSR